MSKIYVGKGGFQVELNPNQFVHCYPAGGGFEHKIPLQQFLDEFKEQTEEPPYRAAKFSFDDGETFIGYHTGERWNGWACPCFEHEVVLEIQKQFACSDLPLRFNKYDNTWQTVSDDPEYVEYWGPETIVVDGVTKVVYAIGSWSWCWNLEEFPPYK